MTDQAFDVTGIDHGDTVPAPSRVSGALAALSAELDHEVPVPSIVVPVEQRPGWAVRYRTNVSWAELQSWRKRAVVGKNVDVALLSRFILANTCLGFVKDGADAVDEAGEPITFGTVASQRDLTVADAVKVWLVTDGAVSGTSDLVYERSGYRMPEEVPDADPTGD